MYNHLSNLQRTILALAAQNGGQVDRPAVHSAYYRRRPTPAAHVAVCKAIGRLRRRGLLARDGKRLTAAGRREAGQL
jgi:hypothetical protein